MQICNRIRVVTSRGNPDHVISNLAIVMITVGFARKNMRLFMDFVWWRGDRRPGMAFPQASETIILRASLRDN